MKKAWKAYWNAIKEMRKYRDIIIFLYLLNFMITFIAASPFTYYFRSKIRSTDILEGYSGYDLTVLLEFINNYGSGLEPMITQLILFAAGYLVLTAFTNAGILYAIISRNHFIQINAFFSGGIHYFWKLIRLGIYFMAAVVGIGFLILKTLNITTLSLISVGSESVFVRKMIFAGLLFTVLTIIFSLVKQYAKIYIAVHQRPVITISIIHALQFIFRRMIPVFFLFIFNVGVLLLIIYLYYLLKNTVSINSWILIFILGQFLLVIKIFARIVRMSSNYKLFQDINGVQENLI